MTAQALIESNGAEAIVAGTTACADGLASKCGYGLVLAGTGGGGNETVVVESGGTELVVVVGWVLVLSAKLGGTESVVVVESVLVLSAELGGAELVRVTSAGLDSGGSVSPVSEGALSGVV